MVSFGGALQQVVTTMAPVALPNAPLQRWQTNHLSWRRMAWVSPVWALEITSLTPLRPGSLGCLSCTLDFLQEVSVSLSPTLLTSTPGGRSH